jgi:serine/threonine protein kinase
MPLSKSLGRLVAERRIHVLKTEIQATALLDETVTNTSTVAGATEIAGYRLQSRIGMGGFGEVWRAIGPGGFPKAVKILFGSRNGPQAETELRSMNRICELRHPFLLTIERVEIVDGRVIIVSELADKSLDDRYREIAASGQKGIPREELIGYLRDAADALDFMSDQHGLQHLDVKPENILLQGVHAKIGDFGLTKSLNSSGHSIVNGYTPLYAPPELFDGQPERGSDQYSLAIVYQVMLTGVPPFNGRSAAQLTAQHLRSAPDVSVMHPSDRAVVARALSKNPKTRFASCRQFIDELARRRSVNSSLPKSGGLAETEAPRPRTDLVENIKASRNRDKVLPAPKPLRPPTNPSQPWMVRPTVFISIGGLGASVLAELLRRIRQGMPGDLPPSIQFVCIDADSARIEALERRVAIETTTTLTTVRTPLRTSYEYRKTSGEYLNWLSRRWLFNVPRSGRVEGMRPLGRLAFIDHSDLIRTQLEKAIDSAFDLKSIEASKNLSSLPFSSDAIDIVLVGATSGGTCSGSLIDSAWMLRSILAARRLPPCGLSAVMLHGTENLSRTADMQDANTLSFLQELHHVSLPGFERPGASMPSEGDQASAMPFDEAIFVHLGDDLADIDFQTGTDKIAQYLELRSVTKARAEIDGWRNASAMQADDDGSLKLRTFSLAKVAFESWDIANSESQSLTRSLLQRWVAYARGETKDSIARTSPLGVLLHDLALTEQGIVEVVPRLLNAERTRRIEEYAWSIWSRLGSISNAAEIPGQIGAMISQEAGLSDQKIAITAVIEDIRRDLSAGLERSISKVATHLRTLLETHGRINSADHVVNVLMKSIDQSISVNAGQQSELRSAFTDLCNLLTAQAESSPESVDENSLRPYCRQYCMLLVCQTVCQSVGNHLRNLRDGVFRFGTEKLSLLRQRISTLSSMGSEANSDDDTFPDHMLDAFDEHLTKTRRFELSALLQRDPQTSDLQVLNSEAASFLFKNMGPESEVLPGSGPHANVEIPNSARPVVRNVGGGQRVLLALPEQIPGEPWKQRIQAEFGPCVSLCSMSRTDITLLYEVEGIAISALIDNLSHLKPKVVELAERLHTRQDIHW